MKRVNWFIMVIVLSIAVCVNVQAASSSFLMEKGVYAEETLGNLEEAANIYNQILEDPKTNRQYAAAALYHLGNCYLKQGKTRMASAAFGDLVINYEEQSKLTRNAELLLASIGQDKQTSILIDDSSHQNWAASPELSTPKWPDGLTLKYDVMWNRGSKVGTSLWTINTAVIQGKEYLCTDGSFAGIGGLAGQTISNRVFMEKESLRPVVVFHRDYYSSYNIRYNEDNIDINYDIQGIKRKLSFPIDHYVGDVSQANIFLASLPLDEGFEITVPVFFGKLTQIRGVKIKVIGRETVTVPAGTFDCYKIEASTESWMKSRMVRNTPLVSWVSIEKGYIVKGKTGYGTSLLEDVNIKPKTIDSFKEDTPTDIASVP